MNKIGIKLYNTRHFILYLKYSVIIDKGGTDK